MIAIRLMGKRQIGDMQPNELVITLLISEIASIPLQDASQPMINGVIAIFLLVILEICVSVIALKSFFARKLIGGKSAVIIKNGEIDQHAMARVRMTVIDLVEMLRKQNVFNVEEVDWAVLEVSGNLSVLQKRKYNTLTLKTLDEYEHGSATQEGLPLPVISDGRLVKESLSALELTQSKVQEVLAANNAKQENVFLMTADRYGNNTIIMRRR